MDKLVEECTETDEEVKLAKITLAEHENRHKNKFSFCTLYIVLFSIIITVNTGIGTCFIYHKYMNLVTKKTAAKESFNYQTTFNYQTYKMTADVKSINIKNRTHYFFNDMINIEVFHSNLLKIDKKSYKNSDIYNIGYITITKIDDYENIYSVNRLYLIIGKADGFIEGKNGSKYLVFDSTDENKEVLKNRTLRWNSK